MIRVHRGLPEPQARPVRRDRQDLKGLWALQDPLGQQGRLDRKVLKAPRVTLVRKDPLVPRARLDRRDLQGPWVQQV